MSLYRKYRPASFAEVVGQEQVTVPLSAALDSGRINHAYLFSGPRGCGKTSSARILARSLNCVEGPTSTPCGMCDSCRSLAPDGPGNLDVTELDAASHNGVDDMRELRDRAYYAPAESRYRVFIIDEAHMISNAGSNALLKIVEEPPAHLIFIFATTEPEKVIGTIRSRTHHYPFRLLAPQAMRDLLRRTAEAEGIEVEESVYPLIIRAGGGSPRDSLSILDQLIAGSGPDGLTYQVALPLLGVTDLSLLDDTVDALANGDKAGLLTTIDHALNTGIEPRRYIGDLLDRLRDLMVLQAVPEALKMGLVDAPADRAEVLTAQAQRFTGPQITRLAEEVNSRLGDLSGATSPRLLLEILAAHLLLPAETPPAPLAESPREAVQAQVQAAQQRSDDPPARVYERPSRRAAAAAAAAPTPAPTSTPEPEPTDEPESEPIDVEAAVEEAPAATTTPQADNEPASAPAATPEHNPADLVESVREKWQAIRHQVGKTNKVAQIMLAEAKVLGVEDGTLLLGHNTGALAGRLNAESNNADIVAALKEEVGVELAVHCQVGTNAPTQMPSAPAQSNRPAPREHRASASTSSSQRDASEPEEPARPAPAAIWDEPAALGGAKEEQPPAPEPEPAPEVSKTPDTFADGVPLPPEPDEPSDPEEHAPAQDVPAGDTNDAEDADDQEFDRAVRSEGRNQDHRDAMAVAMDLLASELDAKPL